MQLLLDTHILLWWLADDPTLSMTLRHAIRDKVNVVFVSAVSVWEIAIKKALGKLVIPDYLFDAIHSSGFEALNITFAHAELAGQLPDYHADPFDRMLIAQARLESLTLVTHDKRIRQYEVETLSG
ncbi:MAG: twitching motility protein PilT [Gammaproteobacteria bacterium RIFCSPHIGHO2_12_FULL_41_15]|nr:MAG: twitching motility protein PilT [Gammaproteobacteria bacterium RIFCSPHIGHO2_12_FULL_41_15]